MKSCLLRCAVAAALFAVWANAASASTVTFAVTGTYVQSGSTWSVDTATGVVTNSGLSGSANITLTGLGSGAEGSIDGFYDTDDHGFFFRWAVVGAPFGPNYGLIIPDFFPANFVGFTGGTFTDAYIYYNGDNNLPTGLTITFSEVSATPLPAALPLFASGLGALGLLGWRRKKMAAAIAA